MKASARGVFAFILLVLLAVSLVGEAAAQQALIEEINVRGNRRIPQETIRARMFTRPGDVYDPQSLQRDFHSLWNTGYFEDLRIERSPGERGGWIITVFVREKPNIREITYDGLSSVTQSEVLERYKERKLGLTQESQYDPTKVKRAEVILKELLSERGRQFATVRSEVRPIPPAAVGLTFVIEEGPKVKVGNIEFEGNQNLSDRQLRRAMKNLRPIGIPYSIFLEGIFSKTFDATKLNEDAERVRNAYQEEGYFKALVQDPVTEIRDTGGGFRIPLIMRGRGKAVDITVPIEEGERFTLGAINFTNYKAINNPQFLRSLFPIQDGDIFNVAHIRKGLENLTKAYGELGHIKFTPVPNTEIDDEKRQITLEVDLEEGKAFSVRRIEFLGNTTTRDKVIRRELAVEEGNVYNRRYWEVSLLRLNQLNYFEPLDPEKDTTTRIDDQTGEVDITLKVKEKGKNSIGLTGGVSGLAGSFIGLNYETNNFLGLGETLRIEANVGSFQRNLLFGFTEPYLFDRPIQFGFTVFTSRFDFDQARQFEFLSGAPLEIGQDVRDLLQNFSQSRTGFTVSTAYQLRRSFRRVGLTYAFDTSSINAFSSQSRRLFELLAFRGISGPNALQGIRTSKILPSLSSSTIDHSFRPTGGYSYFIGGDVSGLGGNVRAVRPLAEWKHFFPVRRRGGHTIGYRVQGAFLSGYGGRVAPPFERFYLGGDNDIRGFDIRTISPMTFLVDKVDMPLLNPDGTRVPKDPDNLRLGFVTVPIPVHRLVLPGADTSLVTNFEYRIPIASIVTLAGFTDFGLNFITRQSQLRINEVQLEELNQTQYGCPVLAGGECSGGTSFQFDGILRPISGTNFLPRMSVGLEVQVLMPIVNAPLRVYWAYNPLRLDTLTSTPSLITRDMFPPGGAGDFTFQQATSQFAPDFRLREPRKTFRFTISTTF